MARALATRPQVLLLDEPAAGANETESGALRDLLLRLRETFDFSILLIEHDMPFVMGLVQRLVVLDHGTIIAEGRPEEIRKDERVIEAYLGRGD
jgi:ABC-type branched-subunit amino acid transport system ATPase component